VGDSEGPAGHTSAGGQLRADPLMKDCFSSLFFFFAKRSLTDAYHGYFSVSDVVFDYLFK
jgi:hypothetical protein